MGNVPFYYFWNPQSGLFGGMIAGVIFMIIVGLIFILFKNN